MVKEWRYWARREAIYTNKGPKVHIPLTCPAESDRCTLGQLCKEAVDSGKHSLGPKLALVHARAQWQRLHSALHCKLPTWPSKQAFWRQSTRYCPCPPPAAESILKGYLRHSETKHWVQKACCGHSHLCGPWLCYEPQLKALQDPTLGVRVDISINMETFAAFLLNTKRRQPDRQINNTIVYFYSYKSKLGSSHYARTSPKLYISYSAHRHTDSYHCRDYPSPVCLKDKSLSWTGQSLQKHLPFPPLRKLLFHRISLC